MTNSDLRPLSVGEILDRTFSLYRQHFVSIVAIAALPQLAILPINLGRLSLREGRLGQAASGPPVTVFRNYSPNDLAPELIMLLAIYGLFYPLASGGLVFGVSETYFGRATTIGVSLGHSWSQLGRLCVVAWRA
ncbi:MAG TPA: hypothetical protein VIH46_08470 [Candidatus Acidoferrales bacterium]